MSGAPRKSIEAETPPGPGPYAWLAPTAPVAFSRPDTASVLIARSAKSKIEELLKERDELRASTHGWFEKAKALRAEADELRVENNALRKMLDDLKQFDGAAARVHEHGTRLDKVPSHHGRRLRVINVGWDPEGDHGL